MLPRSDDHEIAAAPTVRAGMRAWRGAHPRATFLQIEEEATRQVAALRATLIQEALAAGEPADAPPCAACDRAMVRNGMYERTIITSQREAVEVRGRAFPPWLRRWTWGQAAIRPGSWRGRCVWAWTGPSPRPRHCWRTSPG